MSSINGIILIGKMGSGKDYVADWLVKEQGFVKVSFATAVKEFFHRATDRYPNKGRLEDRQAVQHIGAYGREINSNFWCDILQQRMKTIIKAEETPKFVVSDCRYKNEADHFPAFFKIALTVSEEVRRRRLEERDGVVLDAAMGDDSEQHVGEIEANLYANVDQDGVPESIKDLFI